MLPPGYEWFENLGDSLWVLHYRGRVCAVVTDYGREGVSVALNCDGDRSNLLRRGTAPSVALARKHVEWWAAWRERKRSRDEARAARERIDGKAIAWDGESEKMTPEQVVRLLQYCVQSQKDRGPRSDMPRRKAPSVSRSSSEQRDAVSEMLYATFGSKANFQRLLAAAVEADAQLTRIGKQAPTPAAKPRPPEVRSYPTIGPIHLRIAYSLIDKAGWSQGWGGSYAVQLGEKKKAAPRRLSLLDVLFGRPR